MRRADSGFALGCLGPRPPTPVELAFLGFADLQRRLTALLPGVLRHRRASETSDPASCGNKIFIGVLHPVSLRSSKKNWCHLARSVRVLDGGLHAT